MGSTEPFNITYKEIMRYSWWKLRREQLKNREKKDIFIGRRSGNVLIILNTVGWSG